MHSLKAPLLIVISFLTLSGCSVFGDVSVKIAPFKVIEFDGDFEVRHYERLVLVSTNMPNGMDSASNPFYRLFNYISGENDKAEKIAMTAPVFMEQEDQKTKAMSFVLPEETSLTMAPLPSDQAIQLTELKDYIVAVITFSGFLNQKSVLTHRALLENWIADRGFKITGAAKAAGYNPPFTLPFLRRNEIIIPIKKTRETRIPR